jgi:hypothetical protein
MRLGRMLSLVLIVFMISGPTLSSQAQEPAKQTPAKEEAMKAKEQKKVFCATRSEAIRALMINNINCEDQCKGAFSEYQCDTNKDLKDGWRITSFGPQEVIISRSPCECKITGTEAQMER